MFRLTAWADVIPCVPHKECNAGIAQVVEQKTENLCVVGSTPALGTNLRFFFATWFAWPA